MVTEQEARDMAQAILDFQDLDSAAARSRFNADIATAEAWFQTIAPPVPTNRDEALANFNFINGKSRTETDQFRLIVLRQKLNEANEDFKRLK